eukprot:6032132-Pleurochrysis_carterae.AAC.6
MRGSRVRLEGGGDGEAFEARRVCARLRQLREIARRAALPPPQEFVVRNDCPCGSTIGPIISAVRRTHR